MRAVTAVRRSASPLMASRRACRSCISRARSRSLRAYIGSSRVPKWYWMADSLRCGLQHPVLDEGP